MATHTLRRKNWRHIKNILTTIKLLFLCKQVLNYMYQMLMVEDWNYLTTQQKKPVTHKCVATPWLRTTALEYAVFLYYTACNDSTCLWRRFIIANDNLRWASHNGYQYFNSSFWGDILAPKKYKPLMEVQKSACQTFIGKKLRVNWLQICCRFVIFNGCHIQTLHKVMFTFMVPNSRPP